MRHPRRDLVFVSLAGPATNLTLMVAAAVGAKVAYENAAPVLFYGQLPLGIRLLFSFAVVNLLLGLFNLLPIPPLDGSALLERLLPGTWLPQWYKFRPYGFLLLFLLVFSTGVVSEFLDPFINQLFDFVFR
jgi:Zn-dependent protease